MLILHDKTSEEMTRDAIASFPDECCGFFFGEQEEEERIVTAVQIVVNAKEGDKRRRFEITAKDYLKAEQFAEENKVQLLGVYHSHPNHPAVPSEHDRAAALPNFSYIIISVNKNGWKDIRSWRLNREHQFEEEIVNNYQLIKT